METSTLDSWRLQTWCYTAGVALAPEKVLRLRYISQAKGRGSGLVRNSLSYPTLTDQLMISHPKKGVIWWCVGHILILHQYKAYLLFQTLHQYSHKFLLWTTSKNSSDQGVGELRMMRMHLRLFHLRMEPSLLSLMSSDIPTWLETHLLTLNLPWRNIYGTFSTTMVN